MLPIPNLNSFLDSLQAPIAGAPPCLFLLKLHLRHCLRWPTPSNPWLLLGWVMHHSSASASQTVVWTSSFASWCHCYHRCRLAQRFSNMQSYILWEMTEANPCLPPSLAGIYCCAPTTRPIGWRSLSLFSLPVLGGWIQLHSLPSPSMPTWLFKFPAVIDSKKCLTVLHLKKDGLSIVIEPIADRHFDSMPLRIRFDLNGWLFCARRQIKCFILLGKFSFQIFRHRGSSLPMLLLCALPCFLLLSLSSLHTL